jgi:hypothetical protein
MLNMLKTHEKHNTNMLKIVVVHSFLQEHNNIVRFTSHGNVHTYAKPKPFSLAK